MLDPRLDMASVDDDNVVESVDDSHKQRSLFAGFDLGTSGCRVSIIESSPSSSGGGFFEVYNDSVTWKECGRKTDDGTTEGRYDDPESWWIAIETLLKGCSPSVLNDVASMCISGTSASCLIVDRTTLDVTRAPRMYNYDIVTSAGDNDNDKSGSRAVELLQKHLPPKHTARSTTGSFAKLVKWILQSPLTDNEVLCHQSDLISTKLMFSTTEDSENQMTQQLLQSDWQNCLKLGYDVQNLCWPLEDWMGSCLREAMNSSVGDNGGGDDPILRVLPTKVVSPGAPLGCIDESVAKKLGLSEGVIIVGGTTDSNAAFYAAAASVCSSNDGKITIPYGTAVTSLGSTTAIKFLSKNYVEDSTLGVYSHRFPSRDVFSTTTSEDGESENKSNDEEAWLVGGASNVGCAVFRALGFTDNELKTRSKDIDPSTDSEAYLRYKYYPLLSNKVGERFPTADPTKESILHPLPDIANPDDARTEYLKGLFQSIATEVECKGYEVLRDLGASPPFPTQIMTAGGGSRNNVWTSLRERIINDSIDTDTDRVQVGKADQTEASYGAALLAAAGSKL